MRHARILGDGPLNYYHAMSRVIERRFILGEQEQEHFRKLMRAQEAFAGVRVLTWNCMSNHFHLLVAVESRGSEAVQQELALLLEDDAAFLARLRHVYAPDVVEDIGKHLERLRGGDGAGDLEADASDEGIDAADGPTHADAPVDPGPLAGENLAGQEARSPSLSELRQQRVAQFKQPYLERMHDLSAFVGELKQRLSQWYNRRAERTGPLWEDRFKSVLVQGAPGVLATVAAYIDLNAVRAGIVKDPKEWRWCGYAEAVAAQGVSRNGVFEVLGEDAAGRRDGVAWRQVHQRYRQLLLEEGRELRDEDDRVVRKGITPEQLAAEEACGFALPAPALLRHRIRYFVDGLALGSAAFVEGVFVKNRGRMGVLRTSGARKPKQALGGLHTLRDLRAKHRLTRQVQA